jgi:hypothetical protein
LLIGFFAFLCDIAGRGATLMAFQGYFLDPSLLPRILLSELDLVNISVIRPCFFELDPVHISMI